jgi:hypothetical protein
VVKHLRTDELHRVEHLGPPADRDPEYIRDRDFDHLVQLGGGPPTVSTPAGPSGPAGVAS